MRRPALCFAQGAAPPAARFGEAETRGRSPRKPPQAAGGGRNSHPVPTTPLQGKAAKKSAGFFDTYGSIIDHIPEDAAA